MKCVPSLPRHLEKLKNESNQIIYKFVADMRIFEFQLFISQFDIVKNRNFNILMYSMNS